MRLGRILITGYVVDLDDQHMVDGAKLALVEDIYNAVKYNEVAHYVSIEKEPPILQEEDIPDFLKGE